MVANLVFCGRLGSGKTLVSKAVAAATGAQWNSFSSTLKRIAGERGLPIERAALQSLGEVMVAENPREFCERVVAEAEPQTGPHFVLDGLRHEHIYRILTELSRPRRLFCIYIDAADDVRLRRITARDGYTEEEIRLAEQHSTEVQVSRSLLRLADYRADNSCSLDVTVEGVLKWLQSME